MIQPSDDPFGLGDENPFAPRSSAPAAATEARAAKPEGTRIRATEIDRWLECGVREERYRTNRWFQKAWDYQFRGTVVHEVRKWALREYQKRGQVPDLDNAEAFGEAKTQELVEKDDQAVVDCEWEAVWQDARPYVQLDVLGVLPRISEHILETERRLEIPIAGKGFKGKWFLTGAPDAIAKDPVVGRLTMPDLKTGKKKQSAAEVNASTQLSAYALLVREVHGEIPSIAHHALRILKSPPKDRGPMTTVVPLPAGGFGVCDTVHTERTQEDLDAFLRRLRAVIDMREQGYFLPAAGGFQSPCVRCVHRGAEDGRQRCEFASTRTTGEEKSHDEE